LQRGLLADRAAAMANDALVGWPAQQRRTANRFGDVAGWRPDRLHRLARAGVQDLVAKHAQMEARGGVPASDVW
jgi:hypothetical protein